MQEQGTFRQFIERQSYRPAAHGAVLNRQEFLTDFGYEAQKAAEVFTQVMIFDSGAIGRQVVDIFRNAPKSAKKTVVFDAFSNMVVDGLILEPYAYIPAMRKKVAEYKQAQADMVTSLEATGSNVTIINEPKNLKEKLFPYTGRSHLKISYVTQDDGASTAYIHSSNHDTSNNAELAVKFTGKHADSIIAEYDTIITNPREYDYSKQLADDLWVFVDSGKPGESIILDTATRLVTDAQQSIHLCSPIPPSGDFAKALHKAHNDKKQVDVVSTRRYFELPLYTDNNLLYLVSKLALSTARLQGAYPLRVDPYRNLHTKLLLKDVFSDTPEAFFGSHNFADSGVKAGTREVQLLSTDTAITAAFYRCFQDYQLTTQPYQRRF